MDSATATDNAEAPVKRNTVPHHRDFRTVKAKYSVSGRRITPDRDVIEYLETYYYFVEPSQVESIFGCYAFPSKLYGGWGYSSDSALYDRHLEAMRAAGIGIALTTTNHYFTEDVYRESYDMLAKLHDPANSLIITSDDLARRVRQEFPEYALKASITKNLNTLEKVERALELYDYVLVPMDMNDDDAFLGAISEKDRIILFANAGCAYNCPVRSCYLGNSQGIQDREVTSRCSKERAPREDLGYVAFDVAKLSALGFSYFKLIPPRTMQLRILLQQKGWDQA